MKYRYEKKEGNTLILLFGGWAYDPGFVEHLDTGGKSLLHIYDYGDLEEEVIGEIRAITDRYAVLEAVAWSFGVFYASRLWNGIAGKAPERAVALNGTECPVDDLFGIPETVFRGTLEGLNEKTLKKFFIRIFGGVKHLPVCLEHAVFDFPALSRELSLVEERRKETEISGPQAMRWDLAYVGGADRIFPPENMIRFWKERGVEISVMEDCPHYPFAGFGTYDEIFGHRSGLRPSDSK